MAALEPVDDPGAVHNAVGNVLSGSEFKGLERHWYSPVLDVLSDPVGSLVKLIDWLMGFVADGASHGPVAWIIALVMLMLVVVSVVLLTRSVRADESAPVVFAPVFGGLSAEEFEAQATAFEQAAKWREAIRARYAALLVRLGEQGVVKPQAGRTTGEYRQEVRKSAPVAGKPFSDATDLFEVVWYGDKPVGASESAHMQALSADVAKAVAA